MEKREKKIKLIAIMIIVVSIIISFVGINTHVNYYQENLNQIIKTSSPNEIAEEKTIQIKYLDAEGNEILESESLTKNIGAWYETKRKDIPCYRAYEDEPINKRGYMYENTADIVYWYQASEDNYSIEQENNNVTIVYGDVKKASEYDVIVENYNVLGEKISGIQYELLNGEQVKLSEGITENGDIHLGVLTVREEAEKNYIIKQAFLPVEYKKVVENDINLTLNQTWDETNNKYVAIVEYDENIDGLDIEVKDNKIIIKIQYKDNKYDLSVKQFVSEIDGIKQEDNEVKTSVNSEGKVVYTKNEEIEKVENNQEIIFSVRIYNEAENVAVIKDIVNEIPKGLDFINNDLNKQNGWNLYKENADGSLVETENINEAKYIKTSIFNGTELEGFYKENMQSPAYKEIKIAFKVKESDLENGRTVANKVSLEDDVCDSIKNNNSDECSVYVKKFDLKVEKNIVKVVVNNDKGQKTIEKKSSEDVIKVDIPKRYINKTTLNITYEIKVTNVGEINGNVNEITDFLPEGFDVLNTQTTQWNIDGNNAKTTDLKNNVLKPGESESVFIECKYEVKEDSIGSKINSVKITEYENSSGSIDITEEDDKEENVGDDDVNTNENDSDDKNNNNTNNENNSSNNNDEEEVIIGVQTGYTTMALSVIGVLIVITIIVFLLKKKNSSDK